MSQKLAPIDWRKLVKVFEAEGFTRDRQHGSHIAMVKAGIVRPVIIQQGADVPVFIIQNNLKTAGISRERYFEILGTL